MPILPFMEGVCLEHNKWWVYT